MDQNPRKQFEASVQYALQISKVYLGMLERRGIPLDSLDYLEIGPGADFAPQLVLAGRGARVTLADQYLAAWDPDYHPRFYRAFLEQWQEKGADAIRAVLDRGGYDGVITLVAEPVERLPSIRTGSFAFVQSNAVLEHVMDLDTGIAELARITKPGGIHSHQVDFRFHRNFDRPLDHLLMDSASYHRFRSKDRGNHGTSMRMPEMIDRFSRYFWIWEAEINQQASLEYVDSISRDLPADSPYRGWPRSVLALIGGRLWLMRKDDCEVAAPTEAKAQAEHQRGSWLRRLTRKPAAATG